MVDKVTVIIIDKNGVVVCIIDIGELIVGVYSFIWDGMLIDGSIVLNGFYNVVISVSNGGI